MYSDPNQQCKPRHPLLRGPPLVTEAAAREGPVYAPLISTCVVCGVNPSTVYRLWCLPASLSCHRLWALRWVVPEIRGQERRSNHFAGSWLAPWVCQQWASSTSWRSASANPTPCPSADCQVQLYFGPCFQPLVTAPTSLNCTHAACPGARTEPGFS